MKESQLDFLVDSFYNENLYNFILVIEPKKRASVRGLCSYQEKVCVLYGEDEYYGALIVMLHEIAHARIQHQTHSLVWETEFARLLRKYNYPKEMVAQQTDRIGPALKEYVNG